jgi:CBS domain-containing protein
MLTHPCTESGDKRLLLVRQAMREVRTCSPSEVLCEVARVMAVERLSCVIVSDDLAGSAWNVVSALDIVAAASVRQLCEQQAEASSSTPAFTVAPDETLESAARIMTALGITYLVVTDPGTGHPIGVLSELDIVGSLTAA